jgi:hypothetical protein
LVTFNHSRWSTGRSFIEKMGRDGLFGNAPVIVGGQEHRLLKPACGVVQSSMRQEGWNVAFAPAIATVAGGALGTSAGTMIAAPVHIDMQRQFPYDDWDISPVGGGGRVVAAWLPMVSDRGLT